MDFGLLIEGQAGLTWPRWQRLVTTAEELGFAAIYRSDHLLSFGPTKEPVLELWTALTWLASHTRTLEFGPMVSPVSFRDPVLTAFTAVSLDELSGGRFTLGLGTGWNEAEHAMFGYQLLSMRQRFDRLEEGLEVVTRLLRQEPPVSFDGTYYHVHDAVLLPRPPQGRLHIMIGGHGKRRTLPLVARYADEFNGGFVTLDTFADLDAELNRLLQQQGRPQDAVRRSLAVGLTMGRDRADLQRKLGTRDPQQLRARGMLVGTPDEIAEQIEPIRQAGPFRLVIQYLDSEDLDGLKLLAQAIGTH